MKHFVLLFVVFTLYGGFIDVADAATCNAGYYNNNGTCTICPVAKYCPGDDSVYDCPSGEQYKRTTFPDSYGDNNTVNSFSLSSSAAQVYTGKTKISQCEAQCWIFNTRGRLNEHSLYDTNTQKYDRLINARWTDANPGYYLTTRSLCGSWAYYSDANVCPSGSYCPGKARVECNEDNKATVWTKTFGLESCPNDYPNSATGATAINQCYTSCTTASVPNSTSVTGEDYYGDGVDDCIATACADGYTVNSGACVGNTITITWDGADDEDVAANNAGTVIYGGDIRTPKKAQHINGKVFVGWKFDDPNQ